MDAHYSVQLAHPFVIDESDIKKLGRLLRDRIGDVEIRAACADDVVRIFKDVDDLLAFENAKEQRIFRLDFAATSVDRSKRASVEFSGSRWRGISLAFSARDDVVTRLRSDVLDICAEMRPWYAALHRFDFLGLAFFAFLVLWLGSSIAVAFRWIEVRQSDPNDPVTAAHSYLIAAGLVGFIFGVGFVLNRFRDRLFPRAVFCIGRGKARFAHLERIQWTVVIGFVVSFAAGIIPLIWT